MAHNTFRFREHDTIGNPSAEADNQFLSKCFVDNGELEVLSNCGDERGIIVGRTGAGKTALLKTLVERKERAILLNPHDLALSYISNSTVIRFFESLNIKMDLFYRLLWRHVFVVELLKRHFNLENEEDTLRFFDQIRYTLLGKKSYKDAYEYLNSWGTTFWKTTEDRIKEITSKVETELKSTADTSIHNIIRLGAEGSQQLSEEQRREITQRGQEVINKTQISKLSLLFNALDDKILNDPKKNYFIVIDRLDEDWADDPIRYRLIRALIETVRDLNSKIRFAKVIIALRVDLLDLVLKETTDTGFQDEKYRSLCISIKWGSKPLEEMLNSRINELVKNQYTGKLLTHHDLLPRSVRGESTLTYMLDRTLMRPRDLITFFNLCILRAENEPTITTQQLIDAEAQYSQERLRSITDEWSAHYPCLLSIINLLKGKISSFKLDEISNEQLADLCVEVLDPEPQKNSEDIKHIRTYFNDYKATMLRCFIAQTLYRVGVVGLKIDAFKEIFWSNNNFYTIPLSDINDNTTIHVHRMFWRALGINNTK